MNAAKYHGWSDPDLHYKRLEGDAKQWVDQMGEWYMTQATEDLDEEDIKQKSRLLATLEHQSWLALMNTVSEGMSVEREQEFNGYTFIQRVVNPS